MNKMELMKKGLEFYNPEDAEKAVEYFKKAIDADPTYVDAYFWLAYCFLHYVPDWEESKRVALRGLAIDPKRADLHMVLAWDAEKLDDPNNPTDEYAQHLRKAIELEPTWIAPRAWLVIYLAKKKEFDQARIEAQEALQRIQDDFPVPTEKTQWVYEYFITGRIDKKWRDFLLGDYTQGLYPKLRD